MELNPLFSQKNSYLCKKFLQVVPNCGQEEPALRDVN